MLTGVPTGISAASRRMSSFRKRMQPCEIRSQGVPMTRVDEMTR
jgi:hypothetical protein